MKLFKQLLKVALGCNYQSNSINQPQVGIRSKVNQLLQKAYHRKYIVLKLSFEQLFEKGP